MTLALGEAYAAFDRQPMARSETAAKADDAFGSDKAVSEALFWYLHLRLIQLKAEGVKGSQIERATKISKQQVGQIQKGIRAGGLLTLIRFAAWEHRSAGELLDQALKWWRSGEGQAFKERRVHELAAERVEGTAKRTKAPKPAKTSGSLGSSLSAVQRSAKLPSGV